MFYIILGSRCVSDALGSKYGLQIWTRFSSAPRLGEVLQWALIVWYGTYGVTGSPSRNVAVLTVPATSANKPYRISVFPVFVKEN